MVLPALPFHLVQQLHPANRLLQRHLLDLRLLVFILLAVLVLRGGVPWGLPTEPFVNLANLLQVDVT